MIHISTDYVFSGDAKFPYKEDDIPDPKSIYGLSKLKGEKNIQENLKEHIILRTHGFLELMEIILKNNTTGKKINPPILFQINGAHQLVKAIALCCIQICKELVKIKIFLNGVFSITLECHT